MGAPLYSVGTWDTDSQGYTPQVGLSVPPFNITLAQLRQAVRELRNMCYGAYRCRDTDGEYYSDPEVLIERPDGENEALIVERWKR